VGLPPPDTGEVESVLHRALRQLRKRLAAVEGLCLEEDDARLLEGSQPVLVDVPRNPPTPRTRSAVAHGFSLHADTAVHAHDRQGLEITRAPLSAGPRSRQAPRLDWATIQQRTFGDDVFRCPCGGRRKVVAIVTNPRTVEEVLANLGLLPPRTPLPHAQAPPQLSLGL
jgi:hypothetical protein